MIRLLLALIPLLVAFPAAAQQLDANGCATSFDPTADYFAARSTVDYAENFTVQYFGHYKLVTVAQPAPGAPSETYVLVQCGTPAPDLGPGLANAPRITVPVRSLFAGSTSQSPSLVVVDAVSAVTGVSRKDFIATPELSAHVAAPDIVEYERSGIINIEAVIAAAPDLVISAGGGEAELRRIASAGVAVASFADWLETSPLGRAEWLKFTGLFFNEEEKANAAFAEIAEKYQAAQALVADISEENRPFVLSGAAFGGTFFAAGGKSFIARLIEDAGGRYVFADNDSTGSFQVPDLEWLLVHARKAKAWIQAAVEYRTLADIEADDPRLAALPAAQSGEVFMPDALKGPNGGVQLFELGSMRPDMVLMDLISILHPDKTPGYVPVFNRQLTRD
jgi:iron complex transport system substrate-binding protein